MSNATNPQHGDDGRPVAFDNSYARLPDVFFAPVDPSPVEAPRPMPATSSASSCRSSATGGRSFSAR
jgi:hypothetical protein